MTVTYPNLADSAKLSPSYQTGFTKLFGNADLGASWAIMTYNGVYAAEEATEGATGQGKAPWSPGLATAVKSALFNFNNAGNEIDGATGKFMISPDGDEECGLVPIITDEGGNPSTRGPWQSNCPAKLHRAAAGSLPVVS